MNMEAQEERGVPDLAILALYQPTPGRPNSGPIKMTTTVDMADVDRVVQASGLSYVRVNGHLDGYVRDGIVVSYPQRPSQAHVFDYVTDAWFDPRTLEQHKDALRAELAQRRWEVETGGITMPNGMRVLTGRADRDNITSLILTSEAAGIDAVDFKAASGWVQLTLQEVREIAQAIAVHVQACFSAERAVNSAIDAIQTLAEVDAFELPAVQPTHNA
jgi:hypothetical protein